jgi:hypothetical protein
MAVQQLNQAKHAASPIDIHNFAISCEFLRLGVA